MSTEENKQLVRRFHTEESLPDFISPDYVEVHDDTRSPLGLEGTKQHIIGVRRPYPDLELAVQQQIAKGEWVVTRVVMRGTHRGAWMGMEPTGKAVEISAVNIDRVVDGRIAEHGGAANLLQPLLKIKAIQGVGSARREGVGGDSAKDA